MSAAREVRAADCPHLNCGVRERARPGLSANDHFYLTSDTYSSFNGAFLGSKHVPYDTSTLEIEEMEGFAIFPLGLLSGDIHIVILDNALNPDDMLLKHFNVPDFSVI